MFADFPFLGLLVTGYFMLLLCTIFAAFGWCDPNEYQKKVGVDIFGGIMTILFWRYSGLILSTVEAHAQKGQGMMESIMSIGEALYTEMGFQKFIDTADNQLLGLILVGVAIMLMCVLYITGGVFSIYFPFRMLLILDLYIDNIVRYVLMFLALVAILILGLAAGEGLLTLLTVAFGILSIATLLLGNIRLYQAHKNPKKHAAAYPRTPMQSSSSIASSAGRAAVKQPVRSSGNKQPIGIYFKQIRNKIAGNKK